MNGHDVKMSCAVTHENKFYLFGGYSQHKYENDDPVPRKKVLQLDNCGLVSIGSLEFEFTRGACGSLNGTIVLCFHYYDDNQCRQSTSPLGPWSMMTPSTYDHRAASMAMSPGDLFRPLEFLRFNFRWIHGSWFVASVQHKDGVI